MTGLLLVGGFFRSLQFTSVNALSFADMPPERMSRATTLTSVAQQLSLSVGISIGAIALELTIAISAAASSRRFLPPGLPHRRRARDAVVHPFLLLARDAGDDHVRPAARARSGHRDARARLGLFGRRSSG